MSTKPQPTATADSVSKYISSIEYKHFEQGLVVVCVIRLVFNYSVIGTAICSNMSDFDLEKGKNRAKKNAMAELINRERYRLKATAYLGENNE